MDNYNNREYNQGKYPFVIERRMRGYLIVTGIFIVMAIAMFIITRSLLASGMSLLLAALMGILYFIQIRGLEKRGYEVWAFRVIDYTYLTRLHRKPTGFYAEALEGPYVGRTCHISLASQAVIPPLERIIDLYLPGDIELNPIRDVFYVPQYYGIVLTSEDI